MEGQSYIYLQMHTSTYLLQAGEEVACRIRKKAQHLGEDYPDYVFKEKYSDLERSIEYVGLNLVYMNQLAAVLEGTLRTLICESMQIDSERIGELSISKKGKKEYRSICRAYAVMYKYKDDVEFKGGWDNLKRQYKEVFDIKIDNVLDKQKSEGLNSIFTLRNVAAHGTAIIIPKDRLNDASEGNYLFKWQQKLQQLNVYVKKEFDLELLDALQHPSFSYHFTELVKEFITKFRGPNELPVNSQALFNNLENYGFGYRNNYEFPTTNDS